MMELADVTDLKSVGETRESSNLSIATIYSFLIINLLSGKAERRLTVGQTTSILEIGVTVTRMTLDH